MKSTKLTDNETGSTKIKIKFSEEEMKVIRRFSDSYYSEKNIYTKKQLQFIKNIFAKSISSKKEK